MQSLTKSCHVIVLLLLPFACALPPLPPAAQDGSDGYVDHQTVNTTAPAQAVRLVMIHASIGRAWLGNATGYGNLGGNLSANNYYVSDLDRNWDAPHNDKIFYNDGVQFGTYHSGLYRLLADSTVQANGATRTANVWNAVLSANNAFTMSGATAYPRLDTVPPGNNTIVLFKPTHVSSRVHPENAGSTWQDLATGFPWDDCHSLGNIKELYRHILGELKNRPETMFVIMTPAPFGPNTSESEGSHDGPTAERARQTATWLARDWLREGGWENRNVYVFDLFNVLTGPDNHHRVRTTDGNLVIEHVIGPDSSNWGHAGYYSNPADSHPGDGGAGVKASTEFVPLLNAWYHRFRTWRGD